MIQDEARIDYKTHHTSHHHQQQHQQQSKICTISASLTIESQEKNCTLCFLT